MAIEGDAVQRYASTLGFQAQPRTVLLEGTTDVDLFRLAARWEKKATGIDLFAGGFAIAAAGIGQRGGTAGVVRELLSLRAVARTVLRPDGRPTYRFVGLVDNDPAGRLGVCAAENRCDNCRRAADERGLDVDSVSPLCAGAVAAVAA